MSSLLDAFLSVPAPVLLLLVFTLPALEASAFLGLVVPGETMVILGGVAAHAGHLSLAAVIAAAVAGAVVGDQVGFVVGRRYGNRFLGRVAASPHRRGQVDRVLALVRRRGATAVALGRWAAALRALVPGIAGMSGMGRLPFTVANVLGGSLWAVAMAVAGFLAGASYKALESRLGIAADVVLALVVVAIGVTWWRARRRDEVPPAE
jgi:undecaprenyl-diphosphatase